MRHALRFVDDEAGEPARGEACLHILLQLGQEARLRHRGLCAELELPREELVELLAAQRGVVDQHIAARRVADTGQRRSNERGLTGAGFAENQREAFGRGQGVAEIAEGLALLRREEQKARVRREVERRLEESEEGSVQGLLPPRRVMIAEADMDVSLAGYRVAHHQIQGHVTRSVARLTPEAKQPHL